MIIGFGAFIVENATILRFFCLNYLLFKQLIDNFVEKLKLKTNHDIMNELDVYKEAVRRYAAEKTNYLFHNEGSEHALIICSAMFENATKDIRIAANMLCNDAVVNKPEYIQSMQDFLDKEDTHLKILISHRPSKDEVTDESGFYSMLYHHPAYKEKRIEIKDGQGKSFHNQKGDSVHFCTADNHMYRLENDINERKAIANFNDEKATGNLINAFDGVFNTLDTTMNLNDYFAS